MLAMKLMENPYVNVGEFISSLSNDDLQILIEKIEVEDRGDGAQLEDLIVISGMLAISEGLDTTFDVDEVMHRIDKLVGFLVIESLKRKGFVKVFYENMSFGEDMGDKVVVEKIDAAFGGFPVSKMKSNEKPNG